MNIENLNPEDLNPEDMTNREMVEFLETMILSCNINNFIIAYEFFKKIRDQDNNTFLGLANDLIVIEKK